jgi:hydrogenase nickel incorporation protein HypA/HybF
MHAHSLLADLVQDLELIALELHVDKLLSVKIALGALFEIPIEQFRKHFAHAVRGTVAEGAQLQVERLTDAMDRHAHGFILSGVELEESKW